MPVYVPDNFDIGVAAPIDSRTVKATTALRDSIPAGVRFEGLAVYVVQDSITYQLQGGTTNNDWVEIAGGSAGAEYLYNLLDVDITNPSQEDELSYNNSTSSWENRTPYLQAASGSNIKTRTDITNILSKAHVVLDGSRLRMYRDTGGTTNYANLSYSGNDVLFDTDLAGPIFKLTDSKQLVLGGTNAQPDAKITLDASSDPLGSPAWTTAIIGDAAGTHLGLKIAAGEGLGQPQLFIESADGNEITMLASYTGTKIYSRDLELGTTIKGIGGVDHRDMTAVFDNYVFDIADDNSTTGFSVQRAVIDEVLLLQMNSNGINMYAENGIYLGGTEIQGDLNLIPSINGFQGDGTGAITAADKVKTLNYFEGDAIFNHKTLVLPDSSGPNKTKIAEVLVDADEYTSIELDYTIPNSPAGMNKGRVLLQVGYNPSGEITQTVEVPVTVAVDTGYTVDTGTLGGIGILNTNGGTSPPFSSGELIRIPAFSANEMTVFLSSTGTYYNYFIAEHPGVNFATYVGQAIFQDQTTLQEITETIPGDSFITSVIDVKDRSTGETGVTWTAVLNDVGTPKSLQLFATMTIDDTYLTYIAKYQKEGDATITFYDDQAWTNTLPSGTSVVDAQIATGDSYWLASGNNLYNINTGNVGIDEDDPQYKLHINGDMGLKESITFKPASTANETTISAPTELATALKVRSSAIVKDLVSISEVGNVFINTNDNSSTNAKFTVFGDSNADLALAAHSASSATEATSFYGGDRNSANYISRFYDYTGLYSAAIFANGRIDANQSLTVNYGVFFQVDENNFTYNGADVWYDGGTGNLGDLADVDLTGIAVNSHIKWDGNNWVISPATSGVTNLGYTPAANNGEVTSDTGTNATIPAANGTNAGLLTASNWTKLEGISSGAEANVQANWSEANSGVDSYIQNKPTALSDFSDDLGAASHIADTTIHVTLTDKNNWNAAEANVQSNWTESNTGSDSFIQNKPALTSAATTPVDTTVSEFSTNLITSGAVFTAVDGLEIDPSTGFIRFGDNTLRLTQGSTIINVADVPKLDTDGKVLASQTRTLAGGATQVFATTAALEASVQGGTDIVAGDFIYITGSGDTHNGMWIAAVLLTGAAWDMAAAVAAFDVLDVTTGADYYTQTEINNSFASNSITAGDGLNGGGSLAYAGSTINLTVDAGNGLKINSTTKAVEIDSIVGTPTGTVYTPAP